MLIAVTVAHGNGTYPSILFKPQREEGTLGVGGEMMTRQQKLDTLNTA